jgi:hypothetical protein
MLRSFKITQKLLLAMIVLLAIVNAASAATPAANANHKIFIIGDSTVHRHNVSWDNKDCGPDNPDNTLRGWGDDLALYLEYPANAINKSRQGSTAETYRNGPPGGTDDEVFREDPANPTPLNRYWDSTSSMMAANPDGGFLLIQFGSSNEGHYYYGYWNADTQQWEGGKYSNETDEDRIAFTERDFKAAVTYYVDQAVALGYTPILITTPVGRNKNADGSHYDDRGVFPGYVRDVAATKNVQLLDLHAKTLHEFDKYSDEKLQSTFGSCIHNPGQSNEWMDRGHYEPQGSKIVAGWVKELACALPDQSLCNEFSTTHDLVIPTISLNGDYRMSIMAGEPFVDAGAIAIDDVDGDISANIVTAGSVNTAVVGHYNITYDVSDASGNDAIQVTRSVEVAPSVFVYEDAEDGDTEGWSVYDGVGGTIANVMDAETGSRVIELSGPNGTDDGFRFGSDWHDLQKHVFSWRMKYSEDFSLFVSAETTNGYKIFVYQPTDNGNEITHGGARYRFSLGSSAKNGTWQTFIRDLDADLALLDPGNSVEFIYRMAIRGSGRLDDIKLMAATDSVGDETPPTIALKGDATITVPQNATYTDAGATASDNIDGDISAQMTVVNNVDTAVPGSYAVTYRVHDSSGHGAFATRRVEISTIHEDAEDGDTEGWSVYDGVGGTIANVEDAERGSRVITFSGANGTDDGFRLTNLNISSGFVVSWSMKYNEPFKFYVKVRTAQYDPLYIYYTPDDLDLGYEQANGKDYIHNALGAATAAGNWIDITRDIEADLHRVMPTNSVALIYGFYIRGSGSIDDLMTSTRGSYDTFTFNKQMYRIVKVPRTWQAASDAAHAAGGYLAHISDKLENDELYSRLYRYIQSSEYGNTDSATGGNASYVWIGANDKASEGQWRWEDDQVRFWSGTQAGSAVGGRFSNWGRDTTSNHVQHEPDNWNNSQDAAAMAITEWQLGSGALGQSSQWNDLTETEQLYAIIEIDALSLHVAPGRQALHLTWDVLGSIPTNATWQISYDGPAGDQPSPITGLAFDQRGYTLTGLANDIDYQITLRAVVTGTVVASDTKMAMPVDNPVFLPLVTASVQAGGLLQLDWSPTSAYSGYQVWASDTPYFRLSGTGQTRMMTTPDQFLDDAALGDPASNHYYRVMGIKKDGGATISGSIGEFDFALTAGG